MRQLLNGSVLQDGNTRDLIFDLATLVAYVSNVVTLERGDVILTGTPDGVGYFRDPPVALRAGDVVEVVVDGVPPLSNPVVAAVSERFLVTGAYGCIGAWILRQLVDEGVEVVAADAGTDDHRVAALLDPDERSGIAFVRADVSQPEDVRALFEREPTHVIHLAALQVPACRADPVRGAQVNVVGTVTLLAAAAAAGLRTPFVYASSAAAFAAADGGDAPPEEPSGHPDTHYGVYKLANEESARVFAAESGLASIGLRPYVVYGPGRDQGLTSAPTAAMQAAARGEGSVLPYSGRSQLQYAPDVAAAFVAAARATAAGATVVNVPGVTADAEDVVAAIERAVPEVEGRIEITGPPLPFPPELDSSAFAEVVGAVQVTPLEDGVAATVAHFRRRLAVLAAARAAPTRPSARSRRTPRPRGTRPRTSPRAAPRRRRRGSPSGSGGARARTCAPSR